MFLSLGDNWQRTIAGYFWPGKLGPIRLGQNSTSVTTTRTGEQGSYEDVPGVGRVNRGTYWKETEIRRDGAGVNILDTQHLDNGQWVPYQLDAQELEMHELTRRRVEGNYGPLGGSEKIVSNHEEVEYDYTLIDEATGIVTPPTGYPDYDNQVRSWHYEYDIPTTGAVTGLETKQKYYYDDSGTKYFPGSTYYFYDDDFSEYTPHDTDTTPVVWGDQEVNDTRSLGFTSILRFIVNGIETASVSGLLGLFGESDNPAEGAGDYRERFMGTISQEVKEQLGGKPADWPVHHRFQHGRKDPDVAKWYKEHTGKKIHDLDNLRIAPRIIHEEINELQQEFWRPYRIAVAHEQGIRDWRKVKIGDVVRAEAVRFEDYERHVRELDKLYQKDLLEAGATLKDLRKLATNNNLRKVASFANPQVVDNIRLARRAQFKKYAKMIAVRGLQVLVALLAVNEANKAFASQEWEDVLTQYEHAIERRLNGKAKVDEHGLLMQAWTRWATEYDVLPELAEKGILELLLLHDDAGYKPGD